MGYQKFISLTFLFVLSSHLSTVSHSFNIAKFLAPLLRPISVSQYSINDTFSFLQKLFEQKFNNNVVMASFDVMSLFTNIPLDETIKIIADQLFSNSNNFEGFSRDEFVKLLNLAVKNCDFIFNGVTSWTFTC